MDTTGYGGSQNAGTGRRRFPAYGPVDALGGYALFYVLIERATPTVADVLAGVLAVSPSAVGFGLAAALWFALVVTVVDQARRQFASLGSRGNDDVRRGSRFPAASTPTRVAVYALLLLAGGAVAGLTYDRALETAVSLVRVVGTLDVEAFSLVEFVVMGLFFACFKAATWSLDRLLVGGLRALLAR